MAAERQQRAVSLPCVIVQALGSERDGVRWNLAPGGPAQLQEALSPFYGGPPLYNPRFPPPPPPPCDGAQNPNRGLFQGIKNNLGSLTDDLFSDDDWDDWDPLGTDGSAGVPSASPPLGKPGDSHPGWYHNHPAM